MTTKELFEMLGQKGLLSVDGLQFYVTIEDVKVGYGKTNVKVVPVSGKGEKWVSFDRVTLVNK